MAAATKRAVYVNGFTIYLAQLPNLGECTPPHGVVGAVADWHLSGLLVSVLRRLRACCSARRVPSDLCLRVRVRACACVCLLCVCTDACARAHTHKQ